MKVLFILVLLSFSAKAQWLQAWSDEFNAADGTGVDGTYWNYEFGCVCPNSETVCYTNSTDNVKHDGNGNLLIIGKYHAGGAGCGQDYSSGRLTTQGKFNQLYGKWEARIKIPSAQGTWPAFWLLGEDIGSVGWPACGEIDIMETVWSDIDNNHGSGHMPGHFGGGPLGGTYYSGSPLSNGYHIYTAEWNANLIQFYVDGNWYANFSRTDANTGGTWAYDSPMFIILNMSIGGTWPGAANPAAFPDTMYTDYIRVYDWYQDVVITGSTIVQPNETGTIYSVPYDAAYSYTWTIPAGATISSGAGTNQITIDWGTTSGTISVILNDGTYSATPTLDVEVTSNVFDNPSFEFDYDNWGVNNGGTSASSISTTDVQHLTKSAERNVTTVGANTYDIQLTQTNIDLVVGTDYTLNFWAKADANTKTIQVNFLENGGAWTVYHSTQFVLTNTWTEYTFNFTSSVTNPATLFTIDLGYHNSTIYNLDNFYFGTASGFLALNDVILKGKRIGDDNRLSWDSFLDDVEVERSTDGIDFNNIGEVPDQPFYLDKNVNSDYYYRISFKLKDNKKQHSSIIHLLKEDNNIDVRFIDNSFISIHSNNESLKDVEIYNSNGKLVFRKMFEHQIQKNILDFFDHNPGVYVVNVNSEKDHVIRKIIKL